MSARFFRLCLKLLRGAAASFIFSLALVSAAEAEVCFLPTVGANGSCSGSNIGPDPDPQDSCEDAGLYQTEVECKGSATYDSERSYCVKEGQCWSLKSCSPGYNKEDLCKTALQNDEMIPDSEKVFYECVESEQCYNYKRKECVASEGKYLSHDACISGGYECIFDSSDGCYERVSCPNNEYTPSNCANAISGKESYQECIKGSKDGCLKIRDCGSDKYISKDKCNLAKGDTETCKQEGQCWIRQSVTPPSDADLTLYVYYTCDGESCQNNNMFTPDPQVDIYGTTDSNCKGGRKTQFAHTSDSSYIDGGETPYSVFTFKKSNIISEFKEPWCDSDNQGDRTIETEYWRLINVPVMFSMPLSAKEVKSATLSWQIKGEDNKHEYTPKWAWNGSYQTTMVFSFSGEHLEANGVDIYEDSDYFKISVNGNEYELSNIKDKKLTLNIDLTSSGNEDRRNCIYAAVNCSGASMTVDNDYKSNCFMESGQPQIFTEFDDYWGNDYQNKGLCAVDYLASTTVYPNGRYVTKDLEAYSQECATVKLAQGTYGYDLKAVEKDRKVSADSGIGIATIVETINDVNHLRELQNYPDATLYKLCKKSDTPGAGNNDLLKKGFETPKLRITKGSGEDYVFSDPLLYGEPKASIYSNNGDESEPTELIYPSSTTPVIRYTGAFDNEALMTERNDHFVLMSPVITVSAAINKYTSNGSLRKGWGFTEGECNCTSEGCSTTNDGYSVTSVLMDIPNITGSNPSGGNLGGGSQPVSFTSSYEQYRLNLKSSSPVLHTFRPFTNSTNSVWSDLVPQHVKEHLDSYLRINFKADHVYLYKGTKEAISVPNCLHTSISYEGETPGSRRNANFSISSDPELERPSNCLPISQSVAFDGKKLNNRPGDDRVLYSCDDGTSNHLEAFYIFDSGFKKEE